MENVPTKTLDLGCGLNPRNPLNADEVFGIDIRDNVSENIKRSDLAIEPIPFPDNFFDVVSAYDFIEHIPRLIYNPNRRLCFIELMNEVWRVLKPGGIFFSQTPAFPREVTFRDPTHENIITEKTFPMYFDDQHCLARKYGFTGAFEIIEQEWNSNGFHLDSRLKKVLP